MLDPAFAEPPFLDMADFPEHLHGCMLKCVCAPCNCVSPGLMLEKESKSYT